MSVLFKSPSNNSVSIGGSNKGFPPGDVSNIVHVGNNSRIQIKWTDPEDTIVDEAVFVKWKGTLLIRNSDHYPNSIKDGDVVIDSTEKNKYKDIWYEDTNLINDHMYYYRFFPYSEDKVYNDSNNMIFKEKPLNISPILANNTWEQVIAAINSDSIPDTWKIGDEIDLVLSGTFNETVTLQIWDFNHFDKTDGTGKANICFGMKHLMKDKQKMNSTITSKGGWNDSYMRNTIMNNIYISIPAELRNHIKEVNTYANAGPGFQSRACTDKIFIPGFKECGGYWDNGEGTQVMFPIFSDKSSRLKKLNNGSGSDTNWWTRSTPKSVEGLFLSVYDGEAGTQINANVNFGVCFCFNI